MPGLGRLALIRKAAARTYHELWKVVDHVCDLFTDEECANFFKQQDTEPIKRDML